MDIIFATKNKKKMEEIREIMRDIPVRILSMEEAEIYDEIEENGTTFEENAIIKAAAVAKISGKVCLADDSGLEVDYIGKAPGVYSARYMGADTPYEIKNKNILDRLEGVSFQERTARFVCAIALAFPNDSRSHIVERATVEGFIGDEIKGANGFGYDPIFYIREYNMTMAEMDMTLKNSISHRGKALRQMKERIAELF